MQIKESRSISNVISFTDIRGYIIPVNIGNVQGIGVTIHRRHIVIYLKDDSEIVVKGEYQEIHALIFP